MTKFDGFLSLLTLLGTIFVWGRVISKIPDAEEKNLNQFHPQTAQWDPAVRGSQLSNEISRLQSSDLENVLEIPEIFNISVQTFSWYFDGRIIAWSEIPVFFGTPVQPV